MLEAFRHEQTDPAIFREMGEVGLLGATIPEQYGGSGMDCLAYVLALIDINCRFPKPTFIGDTIVVRVTVTEKNGQYRPGKDRVVFRREAINQRGEVVVQADFAMVLRSMEGAA
mgnify:CR=1 FL=1